MGVGSERTTGGGMIAGVRFTPHSALVVWNRKYNALTLYLLPQRGVTCSKLKHEAARPGRLIQVSIPSGRKVKVNKPMIAHAVFLLIPRDPTKPQQGSGLRNGPKVALSRVDTYPGGVWHGRFTVPQLEYGDGRVYAYNGTFSARWCDFPNRRCVRAVRLAPEIIAGMQQLALEQRRLLGPRADWHVGDIAWGFRQHEGRESEWKIRHWIEDGRVVAWSWLKQDGRNRLEHDVHPDYLHLLDEILAEPAAEIAFAFEDDTDRRAALARHGFTEPGDVMHFLVRELAEPPEAPLLPDGFRCRTVDDGDVPERVSIHREVWAPSRVTESSYAQVRAEWPYRASLDCVVEAPDGRFAAYCLCWPDDLNGVAEFEPVGTREEFRRRGLGTAVCTFALRRLHEEGIRQAIVYCASPPACALYESLGFRIHASLVGYSRPGTTT